jgi:hypothetical protein
LQSFAFARLGQELTIPLLSVIPEPRRDAEHALELQSGLWCDRRLALHDLVDGLDGFAGALGQVGLRHPDRFQGFQKRLARR